MSGNLNSNREQRKTTAEKARVVSTGDYHRVLDEEFARRRTFSGCKTDTRLKEIPVLKAQNQEKLDLSHNLIRRIENLEGMKRLRVLNLSHNRIVLIEGIFSLRRMEELNLSHNFISELPKDFRTMTGLKALQLHNNKLAQLESLDSISCLRLVRLSLENNYVCRAAGFRKYLLLHFKWLESLDRKPFSHRSMEGTNAYETPIESMTEEPPIEELRTCERQAEKIEQRDHNTTQRRETKEDPPSLKPEATEIKLVKTERLNKDSEIMPYREYLKKQLNSSMGDSDLRKEQRKLVEGKFNIARLLEEQRKTLHQQIDKYVGVISEFRQIRSADEVQFEEWKAKSSEDSRLTSKFLEMVNTVEDLFDSEQENLANLKDCAQPNEGQLSNLNAHLAKTLKLRQESHDQAATRLSKAINLASLELVNLQNQQFLDGAVSQSKEASDCNQKIRQYSRLYSKAHKLRQIILAQWKDYSATTNRLLQISSMVGGSQQNSPQRQSPAQELKDSSGLKKILFSDRIEESRSIRNNDDQMKQLQELLNAESEKCRELQEELALMSKAQLELKQEFEEEREERIESEQVLEQKISLLTSEKAAIREKWEAVDLFHSENSRLYRELVERQKQILALMQQKLTGDFFQQIILNQAQSIDELLQANKQLQGKFTTEVKRQLNSNRFEQTSKLRSKEHGCSKTQNTRYDSSCVVGIQSSDSNLLEYSEQRFNRSSKEPSTNIVSEFNIHANESVVRESARFKESLSFHNLSRERQSAGKGGAPDYFRKSSSGFSFKKSSREQLSSNKPVRNITTQQSEAKQPQEAISKENEHPNRIRMCTEEEQVDRRSKLYSEAPMHLTDNYKNYLKYYLRNNIIEVLSKGDVHPHLKSRWTKEEIAHRKYHSFTGPRLIPTDKSQGNRSTDKILRC